MKRRKLYAVFIFLIPRYPLQHDSTILSFGWFERDQIQRLHEEASLPLAGLMTQELSGPRGSHSQGDASSTDQAVWRAYR
jgi:hypothetical protein